MNRNVISANEERIIFIENDINIHKNLFILTNFQQYLPEPGSNNSLFIKKNGLLKKDTFDHEIALLFKESDGNVLYSSCSHSGIYNITKGAVNRHSENIKAVIGGFDILNI